MTVFVSGPSSWNTLVYVEKLPDPVPHMLFAQDSYETFGGTSLGKALNLADFGVATTLSTVLGRDDAADKIRDMLSGLGVDLISGPSERTERHLNLMTKHGERVSIYLHSPQPQDTARDPQILEAMAASDVLVMDLSMESRRLLPLALSTGKPVWTDLHDYNGTDEFHQPFVDAADVIFMNADGLADPEQFMHAMIESGKQAVVCTLGAQGALALTADERIAVPAPQVSVIDTNGAGDAFMAATLASRLHGVSWEESLRHASEHVAKALGSKHLHPSVEKLLR